MGGVLGVLRSLVGDPMSRRIRNADAQTGVDGVALEDRLTPWDSYPVEYPAQDEVVRLVQAAVPGATEEAIREYMRMLDDRRHLARKLAERSLIERLPDPKPATLGQRVGPTPEVLAEIIVDALRHERRG